jgi:predicted porin
MRTVAPFALLFVVVLSPNVARAQDPRDAQQEAALVQLINEQLKRIQALEARLAELQQQVKVLSAQQPVGSVQPAGVVPAPDPDEEQAFEHATGGSPPEDPDPESPAGDLPRALPIDAYGSLRVAAAWDTQGHREIRNNATRLGLRGDKTLIGPLTAFARVEVGVNLVANDRVIIQGGDPGTPIGQGSQAITSRLGFVGLETPIGNFSWGKQWAGYYDVAEFTDQFPLFSGSATGAFAAGTDGGLSGTGRAERAFLYRVAKGPVSAAAQMQSRSSSPNDRTLADAWGVSAVVQAESGLGVAAAFNQVRDGVATPTPNEPQLGDEAAIFGLRYRHDRWYAAGTYSILTQHEVDDLGRRFDGNGFELAVRYYFTDRISLDGGYNDLQPDSNHPGDYRLRFGTSNLIYRFGEGSRVFFSVKVEGSRRSDGTNLADHAIATGLNYTF